MKKEEKKEERALGMTLATTRTCLSFEKAWH